jgi:hypothetical protein
MATLSHPPPRPTDPQSASASNSTSPSNTRDHLSSDVASRSSLSDRRPPPPPPHHHHQDSVIAASPNIAAPPAHPHSHRHTVSVSRLNQRSSSGIFALAAAALDRTQNAIATISEPSIRPRHSNSTLSRLSLLSSSNPNSEPSSPDRKHRLKSASNQSLLASANLDSAIASQAPTTINPPSLPYSTTDPNLPPPIKSSPVTANKMHQTSSRLLRMTDDDRPFTKVCNIVHRKYLHLPRRFFPCTPFGLRPSARGHETPPSETLLSDPVLLR